MGFLRLLTAFCLLASLSAAQGIGGSQEWPMFQHDVMHSGSSDARSRANISNYGVIWTYESGARLQHTPIAAEINGDKQIEVIFATIREVYALRPDGTQFWSYDPGTVLTSPPAVGSRTQGKFIAFVSADGQIFLLNPIGGLDWNYESLKPVYSTPVSVADVDRDGIPDILFDSDVVNINGTRMGFNSTLLAARGFAQEYSMVASFGKDVGFRVFPGRLPMIPSAGDLNGDGMLEIITFIGNTSGGIIRVENIQGDTLRLFFSPAIISPIVNADLDGDGRKELIYCDDNGYLQILNFDGTTWGVSLPKKCIYAIPTDLNMDNIAEIVTASSDGAVTTLTDMRDSDGEGLIDYWEDMKGTDKLNPDTDGDGIDDLIDSEPLIPNTVTLKPDQGEKKEFIDVVKENWLVILIVIVISAILYSKRPSSETEKDSAEQTKSNSRFYRMVQFLQSGRRRRKPKKEESVKTYFKRGVDTDKSWDSMMAGEAAEEDPAIMKGLVDMVSGGPVPSGDAAVALKVSPVKLAKHATKLEEMGYLIIDGSQDPSNPILKPTGKKPV
jgi:hypothetical protein